MSPPFPITVISLLFPLRRTNSPGKELCYLSFGRKNRPSAIFPSDGRIDSTINCKIVQANGARDEQFRVVCELVIERFHSKQMAWIRLNDNVKEEER